MTKKRVFCSLFPHLYGQMFLVGIQRISIYHHHLLNCFTCCSSCSFWNGWY